MKKINFYLYFGILVIVLSISGCATTGPGVSREEITKAREILEAKALEHRLEENLRVNNVGYDLFLYLPEEDVTEQSPWLGLLVGQINEPAKRLFHYPSETKGVFVEGVIDGSLAKESDICRGDIIVKINDSSIKTIRQYSTAVDRLESDTIAELSLMRENEEISRPIIVGRIPYKISFEVEDKAEVNAYTIPGRIKVSYGLLRFLENEDELAIVLGHELAHNTKGHYVKKFGTGMVSGVIGGVIGGLVEAAIPGLGRTVADGMTVGMSAQFSQDYEREADYFGLKYVYLAGYNVESGLDIWERFAIEVPASMAGSFLSSHPSSPERMLRLEKIIAELRDEEILETYKVAGGEPEEEIETSDILEATSAEVATDIREPIELAEIIEEIEDKDVEVKQSIDDEIDEVVEAAIEIEDTSEVKIDDTEEVEVAEIKPEEPKETVEKTQEILKPTPKRIVTTTKPKRRKPRGIKPAEADRWLNLE